MKRSVIIVAGGKGLRMGTDIPKQFLPLCGKPVLMLTLERFAKFDPKIEIILVLPKEQQDYWLKLCKEHEFYIPHKIADGGETRFHSVKNGLSKISDETDLIAVHDGVRPFVSTKVIYNCYEMAEINGAVIPVIDVFETIRHITNKGSETVPRSEYKLVQTPQVFSAKLVKAAYEQPYTEMFTDDASVIEAYGHSIYMVEGNRENIKITTPYDLSVAECILNNGIIS